MNKIFVTKSILPPFEEYVDEIRAIWDTHILTNAGPKYHKLEEMLTEMLGADYLTLFTNGHSALEVCLQAFGFREGGEVITTPFTFASTIHAIVRCGLKPVLCDIKDYDYTIDENLIERFITDKTVAILPVHVYGNICALEKIEEIAKRYNLKVIYDAAHAFGEKYDGKSIVQFGDASMFSMHATKVFNTIEGGAITCKDETLLKKMERIKNFGLNGEQVSEIGCNAKMNEFCAAMGICNLKNIESIIVKRQNIVNIYENELAGLDGVSLCKRNPREERNYSYFTIRIDEREYGMDRDELISNLNERGIYPRKYFYPSINNFDCYKGMFFDVNVPKAMKAADEVITLPIYPDLEDRDVRRICRIIKKGK